MISNVESQALTNIMGENESPNTELKPCADDQIHDAHVWVASQHFHCLGRITTKEHDLALIRVDTLVSAMFSGGFHMTYTLSDVIEHLMFERVTLDEVVDKIREGFERKLREAAAYSDE